MDYEHMATEIVAARRSGEQTMINWPDPAPTRDDAMAIQAEVFKQFGSERIGWKVGATTEAAQSAFGIDSPFYGPMPQAAVLENNGDLEKKPTVGACEPEYAFQMARDYPESGEDINAETATDAVDSVRIAIEVIGRTIGNPDYANGVGVTMDFGGNVAFILGPKVKNWAKQDLINAVVESKVDGEVKATGNGQPIMGNPINSIVWLAQQGVKLKEGDWISSGTCTAAVPAEKGTTYTATFGDFGDVSVNFT